AATNLIIDPWWVFRVSPLPHVMANVNDRYDFYRAYTAEPDRYDAALMSSSRGLRFSLDELSRHSNGATYALFAASIGRLDDHAAVLDFIVRDTAARGSRLNTVFLLIDIDNSGEPPPSADDLQLLQPPAISREPAFHFWWRNLTAVQVPAWRRGLREGGFGGISSGFVATAAAQTAGDAGAPLAGSEDSRGAGARGADRVTDRPRFGDDMRNWARIVALCRQNDIHLAAVVSPMFPTTLASVDPADVAKVVDQISRLAPAWDFSGPQEPSNRLELWEGPRHFHPIVAQMMLARILGTEVPAEWRNFGRWLGPQGAPVSRR